MTQETAKNIIVMQRPVHYPILIFALTCTKNTLIVVSESHEVDSVILVIICVNFPDSINLLIIKNIFNTYSPLSKS